MSTCLLACVVLLRLVASSAAPAAPAAPAIRADTILIVKPEHKLYLPRDSSPLRSYRIALGLSPTAAKHREWDFRTPQGSYLIDFRHRHSRYSKPPHSSSPSAADRK